MTTVAATLLTMVALPKVAGADEPWREMSIGADAGSRYWSVYTNSVWALYGPITAPGFRLRLGSSYSRYHYDSTRRIGGRTLATRFKGVGASVDALVGYQWQLGTLTTKLYGGVAAAGHTISPFDPGNDEQGYKVGAAGAVELWWNVTPTVWTSLDLYGATAFTWYGATARIGWRALPGVSLGIEGSASSNGEDEYAKIGPLVRAEWGREAGSSLGLKGGEATVAGGVASSNDGSTGAWGRLGVLVRF